MKENLLVTLANKNYINQAKQLFSSVYWKAGWKGDYMLLAHEIPEKDLKWFRDKGILIKKCKPLYNKKIGEFPPVVLDKFYLFTPEFKKWKNIVYLDADIIVRANIDELAKVTGFGAVKSNIKLSEQFLMDNVPYNSIKQFFNFDSASFNTGILSFSTDIIEGKKTFDKILNLFKKYKNISRYVDEGILNLFFYKKWQKLPTIFGLDISFLVTLNPKKINAIMLHFITILGYPCYKPWSSQNFFYNEWKTNLEKAESIDLRKIPEGKKWNFFKKFYYSLLNQLHILYVTFIIKFPFILLMKKILEKFFKKIT